MRKLILNLFLMVFFAYNVSAEINCPQGFIENTNCWSCGSNCTATLDSKGKMTISGTGSMRGYNTMGSTPWYPYRQSITSLVIEGANEQTGTGGITSVGTDAFSALSQLTSITLPNTVTRIEQDAFRPGSLTSLIIPDSVTTIGMRAFYGMSNLTKLIIPDSVRNIGSNAFGGTSDTAIVYCQNSGHGGKSCAELLSNSNFAGTIQEYTKKGKYYISQGQKYRSLFDMQSNNPVIPKRIYTVEEAEMLSKKTGNKFRIRYK